MRSDYSLGMRFIALIVLAGILLTACGSALDSDGQLEPSAGDSAAGIDPSQPLADPTLPESEVGEDPVEPPDPALLNRRVEDFDAYLPPRLIGPDGIRPVYDPRFVTAGDAPLNDDELVIGISIEGEAKAYPITVLRFREMVNDELGELPILVTW
jgi:hypothetical protein